MSSATDVLRHAQICVANQRLHEAFASFCHARDILVNDTITSTSKRVLTQVNNEVERMAAYLKQDPYSCLGVNAASATDKSIKKAYRRLARTYHPDKNKHTQQLFILVKDAYEILSNPKERAKLNSSSSSSSSSSNNCSNNNSKNNNRNRNKMSAEEAFRRRRQYEAAQLAEKKRRHMEMIRKKEAAAKRRREAKNAEARKNREALLQQQMQEQIKRAWQFVQAQAEADQGVSFQGNSGSNNESIGSKLDSIRQRVLQKMNEIRERVGEKEMNNKGKKDEGGIETKEEKEKKERDKIWKERRQRVTVDQKKTNKNINPKKKVNVDTRNAKIDNDGIRVRKANDSDGIRVRTATDADGIRVTAAISNDNNNKTIYSNNNNYATSETVSMEPPDESKEEINSFFASTMGVHVERQAQTKTTKKNNIKAAMEQEAETTKEKIAPKTNNKKKTTPETKASEDLSAAATKLYQAAKRKTQQAEIYAFEAAKEAARVEAKFQEITKKQKVKEKEKEKEKEKVSKRIPSWKVLPTKKNSKVKTMKSTGGEKKEEKRKETATTGNSKSNPINKIQLKPPVTILNAKKNAAKQNEATNKKEENISVLPSISTTNGSTGAHGSLPPVQGVPTDINQQTKSSAKESSFIEEVRNMWRTAVLDAVGLGTDAKFLQKLGIQHDDEDGKDNVRPECNDNSTPRSRITTPRSIRSSMIDATASTMNEQITNITTTTNKIKLSKIKQVAPTNKTTRIATTTTFASNVQRFPCKKCGHTIAVNDMVNHANLCAGNANTSSTFSAPPIFPMTLSDEPITVAAMKSARRREATTERSAMKKTNVKGVFQCQLCECSIPDSEFVSHPKICPGINPTGMFWGKETTAPKMTKPPTNFPIPKSSTTTLPTVGSAAATTSTTPDADIDLAKGRTTDDEEDDEPFLDCNGMNDGDDDFSRFAKTWRSRHTIIEDDEYEKERSEGFFSETGAFHIPPYEEYVSSSEGIATDDDDFLDKEFSDEEFSDDEYSDDDEEPLVSEQSKLEKVLQEGLTDISKEIEQLVFV
jgi:curved DNA-binding protein CbpA